MQPSTLTLEKYLKKHPAKAEYRFLFECCRAAFAGTTVQYPTDIRPEVFLEIVQHHKLVPHLYPILKSHCENVPDIVLDRFQQLVKRHNLHILKLSGELVRLSKLFDANNIPWLSIKGPALSIQLYGDIAMRQSGDLDILVNKEDLDRTIDIIIKAGYRHNLDLSKFSSEQIGFIRKYYRDFSFRHMSSNILVELHWLIDIDRKALINRNFSNDDIAFVQIGNGKIPTFLPDFNRMYLCVHGSHHGWYRLFWLWDFAAILKDMSSEQANQLIKLFEKCKLESALGQTIALAKGIFSIKLANPLERFPVPKRITTLAYGFIFTHDMMSLRNSPFRVYYKFKTFSFKFFFLYYFRRIITFILRKYKKAG